MTSLLRHRIGAIDAFRAITMYLMLFVNDMAGLRDVPHWLKHARADEDMMGFSDLIFPAFLFCLGMSIPFAIQARYRRGADHLSVLSHVAWRTVALVVMGMYILRGEDIQGGMPWYAYSLLMVLSFLLVWGTYPRTESPWRHLHTALRMAGLALMLFLLIDRDLHDNSIQTGWWGILGLIGWTYGLTAMTYVLLRGNEKRLLVAWVVVMIMAVVAHTDWLPWGWGVRYALLPFIPSDWTLHALGMTGMLSAVFMQRMTARGQQNLFILSTFLSGAAMLVAGMVAHQYWIISKIQSTPTWIFFGMALFLPLTGMLYWLCDVRGHSAWYRPIRAAGTATLTCYMIPYVWYAVQGMMHWWYPGVLNSGAPGLMRSALFALVVTLIVECLEKIPIKLKL